MHVDTDIVKNNHVKMINRRSLNTHKKKINITLKDGNGSTAIWKKRRKKGEFKTTFVTYHTNIIKDIAIKIERDDCNIKQNTEKGTEDKKEIIQENNDDENNILFNCNNNMEETDAEILGKTQN